MRFTSDVRRFLVVLAAFATCVAPAAATPAITMDVATGDVLYQQDATKVWFPASTTKLMTVYVALNAIRDRQIALETPLVISSRAHAEPPSKMGFPVGTQVTLENALKMLMVRSANDIAVTIAEGIGGSVEGFADDMNRSAAQLGLRESHFVNPNGLPDPDHYSSARDMAIIARALYTQFPEHAQLFNLGSLSLGREIIGNHNNLLGRYPGVDGMKTGFTCSAGFNIVASAFRDGRRLVVVVFGAPSVSTRTSKVAALFDRGFAGIDRSTGSSILALPSANSGPAPDMRGQVCRNRAPLVAQFNAEVTSLDAPLETPTSGGLGLSTLSPERALLFGTPAAAAGQPMATRINAMPSPVFQPVPVHIGAEPGYNGVVAQARAPHTPIGSEPQPVAATAYAPDTALSQGLAGTPLSVDANALPMRGRKARAAKAQRTRPTPKAIAGTPKTKVIVEDKAPAVKAKPVAKTKGPAMTKGPAAPKAAKSAATATKPASVASKPAHAAAKPPGKKPATAARK